RCAHQHVERHRGARPRRPPRLSAEHLAFAAAVEFAVELLGENEMADWTSRAIGRWGWRDLDVEGSASMHAGLSGGDSRGLLAGQVAERQPGGGTPDYDHNPSPGLSQHSDPLSTRC